MEPIFLLAWRLKKQVTRSENVRQLFECGSYTVRVVREARCCELVLLYFLQTGSNLIDTRSAKFATGREIRVLIFTTEALFRRMQGFGNFHSQIRILDKV